MINDTVRVFDELERPIVEIAATAGIRPGNLQHLVGLAVPARYSRNGPRVLKGRHRLREGVKLTNPALHLLEYLARIARPLEEARCSTLCG